MKKYLLLSHAGIQSYIHALLLVVTLLIICNSFTLAEIRYVSKTGNSTPPYTSWATAADSIQKCIDISGFGDTIYVANGVYKEQVVMIPGLSLIGAGMDSCVIDTRGLSSPWPFVSVTIDDTCLVKGFNIIVAVNPDQEWGIGDFGSVGSTIAFNKIISSGIGIEVNNLDTSINSNIYIYKNILDNNRTWAIDLFNSNGIIRNNIIYANHSLAYGITLGAYFNNFSPWVDSNYIETKGTGIRKGSGSKPVITNNIVHSKSFGSTSIFLGYSDSAFVYNNLIFGKSYEGIYNFATQYPQIINNYLAGIFSSDGMLIGSYNTIKNNVITNAERGINARGNENLVVEYNNTWNNNTKYVGFNPDSTNISVDPMVVNDDTSKGELDFHLQMFSPLIDAGDPSILDRDGSRSDIGLYGGPYGWSYTYQDLAPRPPHNLTAVIEEGLIKLTWNKNTEADFSYYRIYRDTASILIYDSTKIIGETTDTVFFDELPPSNREKSYYYLVTAFDNQGNQSEPSEDVSVIITGMAEHPPIGSDGYRLLNNYPNPFNPSTIIPYRLKEPGYVKLYVYDIKGELVKTLVNQWQNKGYYEVVFHPNSEERQKANSYEVPMGSKYNDIATGVYIYQLMVRGEGNIPVFTGMGKMILLK